MGAKTEGQLVAEADIVVERPPKVAEKAVGGLVGVRDDMKLK